MPRTITIDPVTRISGFLEIRAEAEDNKIVKVDSKGLLFRGFEKFLRGRMPTDCIYLTERICGICSTAHSMVSTLALENALNIKVRDNDRYLRDIIHGFEYLQNHLRHFYLLMMPSYARITSLKIVEDQAYSDFRFPEKINQKIVEHYIKSIDFSRLAHQGMAVLGGKAPHNHGIFVGGTTVSIDAYQLEKVKSLVAEIKAFVETDMMEDANNLAFYYKDYFQKGISYPNFMTYGAFNNYMDKDITFVEPGIMIDGKKYPLDSQLITEQVKYAWYVSSQGADVDMNKEDAYSFIKAPRYNGLPMEVGPLARLIVSGEYTNGHSCMDRNIARVLETVKIANIVENLIKRVELLPNNQSALEMPESADGVGMLDTTRGSLGHWVQIKNKVISHYNLITPSVWNLSPRDDKGIPGVIEMALLGTVLNNVNEPVEIGRIVRSYDPCVSCATHLIGKKGNAQSIECII